MQTVSRERIGKHFPAATNTQETIEKLVSKQRIGKYTTIGILLETAFLFGPCKVVIKKNSVEPSLRSWKLDRIMARKELGGAKKT
jgi:hypothetical protein